MLNNTMNLNAAALQLMKCPLITPPFDEEERVAEGLVRIHMSLSRNPEIESQLSSQFCLISEYTTQRISLQHPTKCPVYI